MAGGRGHAKPVGDSRLKSRAFAAMTGGATRSFERTGESRPGLGLQRPAWPRPTRYGGTGRNAVEGQLFGADEHTAWHVTFVLIDDEPLRTVGSRAPLRLNLREAFGRCRVAGLSWEEAS